MIPFLKKKPKDKKPENVPVWFMWMLGGFVGYALITNAVSPLPQQTANPDDPSAVETKSHQPFHTLALLTEGASSEHARLMAVRKEKPGTGLEIGCWETAQIRYELAKDDAVVEDNLSAAEPLSFTLGRGEVVPGLERGVLGMQKGEVREIALRPDVAFGYPGFSHDTLTKQDTIGYRVTLEGIKRPVMPTDRFGLKIYDDQLGRGIIAQCTDYVNVRINAWKVDGTPVWGGARVGLIHLGSGEAPYAIERGLLGMQSGGKRTVIVPPGYMQPLSAMHAEKPASANEMTSDPAKPVEPAKPEEAKPSEEAAPKPTTADDVPATVEAPRKDMGTLLHEVEEEAKKKTEKFNFEAPADEAVVLEIEMLKDKPTLP